MGDYTEARHDGKRTAEDHHPPNHQPRPLVPSFIGPVDRGEDGSEKRKPNREDSEQDYDPQSEIRDVHAAPESRA